MRSVVVDVGVENVELILQALTVEVFRTRVTRDGIASFLAV
jgi:hypothetical protein